MSDLVALGREVGRQAIVVMFDGYCFWWLVLLLGGWLTAAAGCYANQVLGQGVRGTLGASSRPPIMPGWHLLRCFCLDTPARFPACPRLALAHHRWSRILQQRGRRRVDTFLRSGVAGTEAMIRAF